MNFIFLQKGSVLFWDKIEASHLNPAEDCGMWTWAILRATLFFQFIICPKIQPFQETTWKSECSPGTFFFNRPDFNICFPEPWGFQTSCLVFQTFDHCFLPNFLSSQLHAVCNCQMPFRGKHRRIMNWYHWTSPLSRTQVPKFWLPW